MLLAILEILDSENLFVRGVATDLPTVIPTLPRPCSTSIRAELSAGARHPAAVCHGALFELYLDPIPYGRSADALGLLGQSRSTSGRHDQQPSKERP